MNTALFYFIMYILEGLIFWQYCSFMFTAVISMRFRILLFVFGYALCFACFVFDSAYLNTLLFLLINIFLLYFCYDIKWHLAIFHSFFASVMMLCGEFIVVGLQTGILLPDTSEENVLIDTFFAFIFSKFLYFFFLQIAARIMCKNKELNSSLRRGSLLILLIPFFSVIVLFLISAGYVFFSVPQEMGPIFTASSILLLAINLLVFGIHQQMQQNYQNYTDLQLQLQREKETAAYYHSLQKQEEEQRILLHDLTNHLLAIEELNQNGLRDKISSYITNLLHSSSYQMPKRVSDNDNINAIISRYLRLCKEKNILLLTDIRGQMLTSLSYIDLTSLLCNLMDNAVESADGLPDAQIELGITPEVGTVYTIITIANSCAANPYTSDGRLPSHKKSSHHGFGLKSIQKVIDKYNGSIEMMYKEELRQFYVIIALEA